MSKSPDIEDTVLQVIGEIVGKRGGNFTLSSTLIKDLKICSDDLSMYFVPELERRLDVKIPADEWRAVETGWDVCAVLRRHVQLKKE